MGGMACIQPATIHSILRKEEDDRLYMLLRDVGQMVMVARQP